MLVYFRYFVFIGFLLTVGAVYLLGRILQLQAVDRFILSPENVYAHFFTKTITKNLVCKYPHIFSGSRLASSEENERFARLSEVVLGFAPYERIVLYDRRTLPVAAKGDEHEDIVLLEADNGQRVPEALKGKEASEISLSGAYERKNKTPDDKRRYLVHFVFPLYTKDCLGDAAALDKTPAGAVELFGDVDTPRREIVRFRLGLTLSVIVVFCIIYLFFVISSRRHENIINKQHEEKNELEQAKAIAESKSREKSMFLANITHELRTPLNAIIGFSEILKEDIIEPGKNPKYKEYIRDIHYSGVHLLGLINDILDYSKAEASKLEVEKIDLDLRKIAFSCIRLVEQKATDGEITLIAEIPHKQLIMKGDPKRMKQVILNLLSNAVKFTPPDGEVTLAITEELTDERITINVMDTGIGIPSKLISKALSPFGQIDSSMSRNHDGTGLGLPLTKKLTEIMGGEFIFQSEKDLGTSVTLRFPYRAVDLDHHAVEF